MPEREKRKIMVGFDFTTSNYPAALYTLQQWARCAEGSGLDITFGVSTALSRKKVFCFEKISTVRDALLIMAGQCRNFVCWDEFVTDFVFCSVPEMLSRPFLFYRDFNYGSSVNRLLLLAYAAGCEYLVRVDPGTLPPELDPEQDGGRTKFGAIVDEHIDLIKGSVKVVSRGYKGRLAIRDLFVYENKKKEHEQLVEGFTGIDVRRQVTGGAMFTSNVPGLPVVGFGRFGPSKKELTLVWGSDDAISQILPEMSGSKNMGGVLVPRFDPEGKRKTTVEYYRGVAGMVYLANFITSGKDVVARKKLRRFFHELKGYFLDPKRYRLESEGKNKSMRREFTLTRVAPEPFLAKIRDGFLAYKELVSSDKWMRMADVLKKVLPSQIQVF